MSKIEKQNIYSKREFFDTPRKSEEDENARRKEMISKKYERRARADQNRNEQEFRRR